MTINLLLWRVFNYLLLLLFLSSCSGGQIRRRNDLNRMISTSSSIYREPNLGLDWMTILASRNGKEIIQLINLKNRQTVPLPGINQVDSQPISVSVSANGERIAFVRRRADQTELLVYRRNIGSLQRIQILPKGVPIRVSIDGSGRILAVQVSRKGSWDVDIIRLQS